MVKITRDIVSTVTPSVSGGMERDLGFVGLDIQDVQRIEATGKRFVRIPVETTDRVIEAPSDSAFWVSGFPSMSVVFDHVEATVSSAQMVVEDLRIVSLDRMRRLNSSGYRLHEDASIPMVLPGWLRINGRSSKRPDREALRGISGGGVWTRSPAGEINLVGLVSRFHPSESLLVGSRIEPLLAEIVRRSALKK